VETDRLPDIVGLTSRAVTVHARTGLSLRLQALAALENSASANRVNVALTSWVLWRVGALKRRASIEKILLKMNRKGQGPQGIGERASQFVKSKNN